MHGVEDLPASKRAKKVTVPATANAVAVNGGGGGPFVPPAGRGFGSGVPASGASAPMLELMDMDLMLQPAEVPSTLAMQRKVSDNKWQPYFFRREDLR